MKKQLAVAIIQSSIFQDFQKPKDMAIINSKQYKFSLIKLAFRGKWYATPNVLSCLCNYTELQFPYRRKYIDKRSFLGV